MDATLDPAAFFGRYVSGDQAVLADPYPFYRTLRERAPVLRLEDGSGGPWDAAWHVLDYATVAMLLTDRRMSSRRDLGGRDHGGARAGEAASRAASGDQPLLGEPPRDKPSGNQPPRDQTVGGGPPGDRPPGGGSPIGGPPVGGSQAESPDGQPSGRPSTGGRPPIPPMMLTMDPPDHTRLRRLVTAAFTPRAVEALRDDVRALVDGLLDEAASSGGTFDLVRAFAYPLPTVVIARLLGLPEADWPAIKRWSEPGIAFAQDERALPNAIALGGYLAEAVARRRREPAASPDLIGALVAARDGGDVLSDAELVGQCQLLLVAGHETTSYALATAVLNLLRTPGAWEGLPGQDMDRAVDELLRYDAPFQAMNRIAAADLEAGGQTIRAGEFVWLWVGAANRDPIRFPDPDRLDLDRADNRHLSFGLGIHFCLGAALARLEMAVALTRLRTRFPRLRLVDEAVVWRDPAIRGPKTLPVAWR